MDSTLGAGGAASRLGVPASRVLRWCREGTVECSKDSRGRWVLTEPTVDALVARFGAAPKPHPEGRDRSQLLVLAALVTAPRGLPSARAVAARAGLSPTTASKVLRRLRREGLVGVRRATRLMRGRARESQMWHADLLHPAVETLLGYLQSVELPTEARARTPSRLPAHLWHQVWNADPATIDPRRQATYLAHRAITTADPEALAWGITHLPPGAFEDAITIRGVPAQAAAWARAARALQAADAA